MDDRATCDQRVVQAVLAGDRNAFSDLVKRYQRLVASVAWRYGTRAEEIEDLVSEVFFKVFQNLHRYRPENPFSTWLYRLAANHVVDHGRKSRREPGRAEMPRELVDPSLDAGDRVEISERAERVRSALQEVPARYREVLFLVYVEGFKVEETARTLGLPQGTIKSRLLRGRQKLKRILLRREPELFEN